MHIGGQFGVKISLKIMQILYGIRVTPTGSMFDRNEHFFKNIQSSINNHQKGHLILHLFIYRPFFSKTNWGRLQNYLCIEHDFFPYHFKYFNVFQHLFLRDPSSFIYHLIEQIKCYKLVYFSFNFRLVPVLKNIKNYQKLAKYSLFCLMLT